MTEFRFKAESHLGSLWANLMEMEAAVDESTLSEAREQALCRLLALSLAAGAANAREVQTLGHTLMLLVIKTTRVRDATNYARFDALYKKTRELTEALHAIKAPPPLSECERQPAETALV
jgi:transcriptional regulator NrdR family protein